MAGTRVRHFSWDSVEDFSGLKVYNIAMKLGRHLTELCFQIDTLVMDCEGCWVDVVLNNRDKMGKVKTILLGKF